MSDLWERLLAGDGTPLGTLRQAYSPVYREREYARMALSDVAESMQGSGIRPEHVEVMEGHLGVLSPEGGWPDERQDRLLNRALYLAIEKVRGPDCNVVCNECGLLYAQGADAQCQLLPVRYALMGETNCREVR